MTAQKAKELSLEVWGYLKDHPEIDRKEKLPEKIYDKIALFTCSCPLCEIYNNESDECNGCPLNWIDSADSQNCFQNWYCSKTDAERKKYATEAYNKIKAWNIEE